MRARRRLAGADERLAAGKSGSGGGCRRRPRSPLILSLRALLPRARCNPKAGKNEAQLEESEKARVQPSQPIWQFKPITR